MARNVTIQRVNTTTGDDSSNGAFVGGVFVPNANDAIADIDQIEIDLNAGTDVDIRTNDGAGTQDGDITIATSETIAKTSAGDATLRLNAEDDIVVNQSVTIQQTTNTAPGDLLNITFNADSDASGAGRIHLAGASGSIITFTSNGGNISFGGRDTTLSGAVGGTTTYATGNATDTTGVLIDWSTLNSGGGAIAMAGQGFAGGSASRGIVIEDGSDVNAAGGAITLNGVGGTGSTDNYGVAIGGGALNQVRTIGTGTIDITGTGGNGAGDDSHGVIIGTAEISAQNAAITITGTAGTGGTAAQGIRLAAATDIVSTGSGAIMLTGTGQGTGDGIAANSSPAGNFGSGGTVRIGQGASGTYTGAISLTSLGGSGISLGGANGGVTEVATTGTVSMTANGGGTISLNDGLISGNAGVTLAADDIALADSVTSVGNVTLTSHSASRTIDIGTNTAGTLGLTDGELDLVSAGTLVIGDTAHTGTIAITAAVNPPNASNMQLVNNTGGIAIGANLTALGDLTLTANGGAAAAGAITRTAGALTGTLITLNAATGIGSAGGANAVFTSAATLAATNTGTSGNINVTESDGAAVTSLQQTNGANTGGTATLASTTGNIGLNNGAVLSQGGLVTLTATAGAITDNDGGATTSITNATGQVTLSASTGIGTTGAGAIDTQVATLSATNSTSGDIVINEADGIDVAAVTSAVGAFALTAGGAVTVTGAVTTAGGFTLSTAATATINNNAVAGLGGFNQNGAGTTTVNGTQSYSGATNINAGILRVDGNITASSGVTVNSGGTLGGSGTTGAVTVAAGGALAPGASAGTLTVAGALAFAAGASFNVELGGITAGADYDQLVAGGTVSLANATLNGSLLSNPVVGTAYKIIDKASAGAVSGTFAGLANGATTTIGGRAFQINYAGGDGNDVTLSLGALKISGTDPDPIAVLADVNTTTIAGTNFASPSQSAVRDQILNGDISGTVNAGVAVNGFGLDVSTSKVGGAVNFVNNGAIVIDNAGANGIAALFLSGNGGGVTYSGTGTISNHANTPNSAGLSIASSGGIGGTNLIEVAGSITGSRGIDTADGTTTIVVTGTVTGTGGTAILFGNASSNNTVDLKPTAVITGNLDGSGNDDTVRLSGTGSGTFDLGKVGADFSSLQKGGAATWTVTGTLNAAVGTVIGNGTLLVDGTVGSVLVTDGFGDVPAAVLGGTGTVGNVVVQSAGILAPGASAGTLTSSGDVTFTPGSIFRVEIGGTTAGSQYDVLHLSGTGLSGFIDLGSATIQASLIGGFTPTVGQVFEIIDNDDADAVSNTFAGMSEGAGVLVGGQAFRISYVGGDGNDVTLTAIVGGSNAPNLAGFGPSVEIEQAGPAAVPQILDGDVVFTDPDNNFNSGTLAVSGLLAEDTVSVLSLGFDPGEFLIDDVAGPVDDLYFEGVLIGGISGGTGSTLNVTFNATATASAIDALIQNLTFLDSSSNPTFSRTLSLDVTDAGAGSTGPNPITVKAFDGVIETGGAGDDSFTITGNAHIDAGTGNDTVTFGFRLVDAAVSYSGNTVVIDGPSSHTVLTGFERFVFTDGTVNNADGSPLIDDLFYYAQYHDVWNAHVDADFHYNAVGWHEGRDPNAFFDTSLYQSAYPDVAGADPLAHFDTFGWKEKRVPSLNFGAQEYLAANPDVAAANLDPLWHFLAVGASEGRQPIAPTKLIGASGFDWVYYLNTYADVKAAGVDPLQHFQTTGWKEGRNPNALFDTSGYLAAYTDVAAANINPLEHYNFAGWQEGRDPSVSFDTTSYLAAYPDVAAAHVNPLTHFLAFGQQEGRSPFADGVWG